MNKLFVIFQVLLFTQIVGCASEPPKQKDMTLISCLNDYKRLNPQIPPGLAYNYCMTKLRIIRDKSNIVQ